MESRNVYNSASVCRLLQARFHVIYQEDEALVNITTLDILEGKLPKKARTLVIEWTIEHREELLTNWQKASERKPLDKIEPLD